MARDLVGTARDLCPQIVALRDETESQRCLAPAIVDSLRSSGLCRLVLDAEVSGEEVDPAVALQVFEELATAEASAAWVVWNCGAPSFFGQYLPAGPRADVFGDPAGMYASSTRPTGKVVADGDVYRVSGRWSLVSGCMHADAMSFMCVEEKDGEALTSPEGAPMLRVVFVSQDDCEIVDTWNVGGLRGTGSHDVVLDDLSVPAERTISPFLDQRIDRPIGRMPIAASMSAGHAAACLGVARGALEDVLELGRTKVSVDAVPSMRDRAGNQRTVAAAAAAIEGARAHLHSGVDGLWQAASANDPITPDLLADAWSASVNAANQSRAVVEQLHAVAGTPALYVDFPLERRVRDIQAMLQHIVVQPIWQEQAGAVMMGLEPTNPLFAI